MKRSYFLFILCLGFSFNAKAQPDLDIPLGLVIDEAAYEAMPRISPVLGSKADELPLRASLKEYCPPVRSQGSISSCVGWSVGYSGMTMTYAKLLGWSKTEIAQNAFSALYLYNNIRVAKSCRIGSSITDAGKFLVDRGNTKSKEFDYPITDCDKKNLNESKVSDALKYKLEGYYSIFGFRAKSKQKIFLTKKNLAAGYPVMVGIQVRANLASLATDTWDPEVGDKTNWGGHALVVVGYDDFKNAFQVMNSWGTRWGDEGFFWIKYEDYGDFSLMATILIPDDPKNETKPILVKDKVVVAPTPKPSPQPKEKIKEEIVKIVEEKVINIKDEPTKKTEEVTDIITIKEEPTKVEEITVEVIKVVEEKEEVPTIPVTTLLGRFDFRSPIFVNGALTFEEAKAVHDSTYHYSLEKRDWALGDRFQLLAKDIPKDQYVYVFSIDKEGLNVHWPRNEKFSKDFLGYGETPYNPYDKSTIIIPGEEKVFTRRTTGQDHMIILYSTEEIEDFLERVDGTFTTKETMDQQLRQAFGDLFIPDTDIEYEVRKMNFVTNSISGKTVVPIVLTVVGE